MSQSRRVWIYGNSHGRKHKNKMLASVMTKDVSSKQERSERNKAEKKILRFKSRLVPCQAQTTDTGLSQGSREDIAQVGRL